MTLFNSMFVALRSLVADRVYEDEFPQSPTVPVVPAIRITLITGELFPDVCGNDLITGNPRYQIDVIDASAQARNALVTTVCAALDLISPPGIMQDMPSNSFDAQTKRYRATFDYEFNQSSA